MVWLLILRVACQFPSVWPLDHQYPGARTVSVACQFDLHHIRAAYLVVFEAFILAGSCLASIVER